MRFVCMALLLAPPLTLGAGPAAGLGHAVVQRNEHTDDRWRRYQA
jgi:hypothetical protein